MAISLTQLFGEDFPKKNKRTISKSTSSEKVRIGLKTCTLEYNVRSWIRERKLNLKQLKTEGINI